MQPIIKKQNAATTRPHGHRQLGQLKSAPGLCVCKNHKYVLLFSFIWSHSRQLA